MNELERFAKKAADYRRALERSPSARALELYPIVYLLRGHARAMSIPIRKMKILDLMSGSGYLAGQLLRMGFRKIHAVEFCEEMCQNSAVFAGNVHLHKLSSFAYLQGFIEEIAPDVIVSLASFHHLISYDAAGQASREESIALQKSVIDTCIRALPESGMLVIADLIEGDVQDTLFPYGGRVMKRVVLKDLALVGAPKAILQMLSGCKSVHGVSSRLSSLCSATSNNLSCDWFRNIIDNKTSIGHKDIAMSSELLTYLQPYSPRVARYFCPWMFSDSSEQAQFLYHKFGFSLDSELAAHISPEDVSGLAERELGILNIHGKRLLGWNLGVIALWKTDPAVKPRQFRRLTICLLLMILLFGTGILLRLLTGIYVRPSFGSLFVFSLTMPLGLAARDILDLISEKMRGG